METLRKTSCKIAGMKRWMAIVLLLSFGFVQAQTEEDKLTATLKEFHQALVHKDTISILQQTDKVLTYGHSNGWIETRADMIKDLQTGYIIYKRYNEDSLQVMVNGNMAHARFVADIAVVLNGNNSNNHLRVLEVWVKKGERWLLFARQAVK